VGALVAIASLGAPGAASTFFYSLSRMETAGLNFPLIAKPDRGARGQGVRVLADEGDLRDYVVAFPAGETFLLQQIIDHEHEAGVIYVRHPAEAEGRLVSLALKEPAVVVGDGSATLRELIARHPRALPPSVRSRAASGQARRDAGARRAERARLHPQPLRRCRLPRCPSPDHARALPAHRRDRPQHRPGENRSPAISARRRRCRAHAPRDPVATSGSAPFPTLCMVKGAAFHC
jgi:hypothetical protein